MPELKNTALRNNNNKSKTHIKLLYWDGDGFAVFYKRLEQGRFDFI
ncbi:IS66 family insertion sequence element accessory protein TnpB [Flavobacterium sp. ZB4R12]